MTTIPALSLTVRNYKCFGSQPCGFPTILPLNIIVGRNNSGKSALLDVVSMACSGVKSTHDLLHDPGQSVEVFIEFTITDEIARRVF